MRIGSFCFERRAEWVEVSCPACENDAFRPFGNKQDFTYVSCDNCQTVYTNPRPSADLMQKFYSQSQNYAYWNAHIFPATEASRRVSIFRPRAERFAEYCRRFGIRGGVLLEVGAAFGIFCEEMKRLRIFDEIIALEPTPDLAQTCRNKGFTVKETFIEEIHETDFADAVAAFEVVEHLFSPADFLHGCHRMLKPNGLMLLTCPNVKGFDLLSLGVLSGSFDHEHVNYFHPHSPGIIIRPMWI